jgi:phosphopentomutase
MGVGELPDADKFGDCGAHTVASIIRATGGLECPTLRKMGLANVVQSPQWPTSTDTIASYGKMKETSPGKDTTTGHWEMAGVPLDFAFPVFPEGFPQDMINRFCREANVPGVLGNKAASGTEIIKELGDEHIRTGMPIVYTSADSVFQIAAHETHFGLPRLYSICKVARKICDDYSIGRVIARPFVGENAQTFKRTTNRHDYSVPPPRPTVLSAVKEKGLSVIGVGKIPDIFNHEGMSAEVPSISNHDGMMKVIKYAKDFSWSGVIMVNLVDFDSLYGHRRDPKGYRKAMEEMDADLRQLVPLLSGDDLLLLSADHGCDPTFRGSDHTREYVPILMYQSGRPSVDMGIRQSFADVAATVSKFLGVTYACPGKAMI